MNKNDLIKPKNRILSSSKIKIYDIDWDRVNKMKLNERYEYFKNLCIDILDAPVKVPSMVTADFDTYVVDESNVDVFNAAFSNYRILRIKVGEIDHEATYDIDWKGLSKLSLEQRIEFIDEVIEELQKDPIKNAVAVQDQNGFHIIDKSNRTLFVKCVDIREQALKGIDIFANTSKIKKNKNKKEKNKKEGLFSKTKTKSEKKPKEKRPKVKSKKRLTLSAVALAMCGVAGLSLVGENLGWFNGINKNKDKNKENLKPNEKTEMADFIINPFTEHTIERNIFPTEEELQNKYEQVAQEPDNRSPRERLVEEYLEEYSTYFNMDGNKVIELARSMTSDYTRPFMDVIGNYLYTLDDEEEFAMLFTYLLGKDELMYKLENYGMTKEDLFISDKVITTDPDRELILRTGEHFGEYIGRLSEIINMDKDYSLAVAYTISSMDGSPDFNNNNNFDGMKDEFGFVVYPSPEAGIISYLINLKHYEEKNVNSLEELSGLYLTGNREKTDAAWVKSVRFFHKLISDSPEEYFGPNAIQSPAKVLELEKRSTQK